MEVIDVDEVTRTAATLKPLRVLLQVVGAPFAALGALLWLLWQLPAWLIAAGMGGWRSANRAYQRYQSERR